MFKMFAVSFVALTLCTAKGVAQGADVVQIATFQADVTPPLGAPLCGGAVKPAAAVDDPLSARGIIIRAGDQKPIVLCSVDWVGIANGSHDRWRWALADAAGTSVDRVSVHVIHQHDTPFDDITSEGYMEAQGFPGTMYDVAFAAEAVRRTSSAAKDAMAHFTPVTHLATGQAKVEQVASNRRILGPDGKVLHVRWTATKDAAVRAFPEGTIDPYVRILSFWNEDKPISVLSYYATHPQSHYGEGHVSADFVGMARSIREQAVPEARFIHFNGAGGNIGAGKYNDGNPENRPVLAQRLADGMKAAYDASVKAPLTAKDVSWRTVETALPPRAEISEAHERAVLNDATAKLDARSNAAVELAWLDRKKAEHTTMLGLLRVGPAYVLHLPGELFVEYQLSAVAMKPDAFVCVAAYGDYGPGYIGACTSYPEGGYETGLYVSRTAPEVEEVLTSAIRALLLGE